MYPFDTRKNKALHWAANFLWPQALYYCKNNEDSAKELVNIVLMIFEEHYDYISAKPMDERRGYLSRCLLNEFKDKYTADRKRSLLQSSHDFSADHTVDYPIDEEVAREAREFIWLIKLFLKEKVSAKHYEIFFARVEDAMKYDEIAAYFDVTKNTAKVIVSNVRKTIRTNFRRGRR